MGPVIGIAILLALGWLFLVLPSRRRQRAHQAMQDEIETGDEIITAGGIHATVKSIEDDVLDIEIAPGTIVRLDRRAVAAVVSVEEELEDEPEEPVPSDDG